MAVFYTNHCHILFGGDILKRLTFLIYFIVFIPLMITGCSISNKAGTQQESSSSEKALSYLKDKGYSIVSNDGKVGEYVLTKETLLKIPYRQYWGVQSIDAKDYLNKTIETYKFTVKNHPLDNYKGNENKQTRILVMVCENKVIGGYSLPDVDLVGGVYSIEGKTAEEVTGLNYQDWLKQWTEKYK